MADIVKILMQGRDQFAELPPRSALESLVGTRRLFGDVAELELTPLRAAFRSALIDARRARVSDGFRALRGR